MADQVQVKLVGDDKAFLKTLEKLRERFKQIQSASNKSQKVVRSGAAKSKTQLNLQRNAVRLLTSAFVRLGRVGVASQKIMQTQIRQTTSLLRKQMVLLKQARIIPQGTGGRGPFGRAATTPVRTPKNDRAQFFGLDKAPTRGAPVGTPLKDVNKEGNFTQAALARINTQAQSKEQTGLRQSFKQTQEAQATLHKQSLALGKQRATLASQAEAAERRKTAATNRASAALRKQSQPLTLLVAKFALMAFAVQTLANIFNSTFGAILRQIDEFQVAAIGTASAISGIAKGGQGTSGEIFNQNLEAALATFEKLEIVAARFFSTGQELQLAFNTLAQRGVVVREEEFETLGKITDQIKLLTGGQNTQIQIQQELRAILDGNVRTTTAFGKALQARGVDIGQLSKEVRATGSLKPFEPFLEGLSAAGPAIRRTLSSVTATFASLFNILSRNIFQDTFDGVVSTITSINNLIIDQRDQIIQVGIFIKNKIGEAWDFTLGILETISATILNIAGNDMAQFATGIILTTKLLKRGPLGILLGISTGVATLSGDTSAFGSTLNTLVNLLSIGFNLFLRALERIARVIGQLFERIGAFFSGGFDLSKAAGDLQNLENKVLALKKSADFKTNEALFLIGLDKRSEQEAKELIKLLKEIEEIRQKIVAARVDVRTGEENISRTPEGKKFVDERTSDVGETFSEAFVKGLERLSKGTDRAAAAFTGSAAQGADDLLKKIRELSKGTAIPKRSEGDFTEGISPVTIDREKITRQLKAREAILEAARTRELQQQKSASDIATAQNEAALKTRTASGREFFSRQQLLRREDLARQIAVIQQRKQAVEDLARRQIELIALQAKQRGTEALPAAERAREGRIATLQKEKRLTAEEGVELKKLLATEVTIASLSKLTDDEQKEATGLENSARTETEALLRDILNLKTRGRVEDEKDLGIIKEQNRLHTEQLEDRQAGLAAFGGETNAERVTRITQQGDRAQAQFADQNTSQADRTTFNTQQAEININKAIKPQIDAVTAAIDATFATLIDGLLEGAFKFRDLATTISKDFITAGLKGLIDEIKSTVTDGLKKVFTALGKGADDAAAGAQRAAQGLLLGFGLLIAVLSRSGNKGDFEATGGGSGGVDQSNVQTRGLIGGDQNIAIAEINNGLQEAMIPTNAILSQIELNTRGLAGLSLGLDPNELAQAITAQVQSLFSQTALQV